MGGGGVRREVEERQASGREGDRRERRERERERKAKGKEGNKGESKLGWRFVFVRGGNEWRLRVSWENFYSFLMCVHTHTHTHTHMHTHTHIQLG